MSRSSNAQQACPEGAVTSLVAAMASPQTAALVFAATTDGLFRSSDGGRSWTAVDDAVPGPGIEVLAIATWRDDDVVLFAGGHDGLHRSIDAGQTWQQQLFGSHILTVATAPGRHEPGEAASLVLAITELDGIVRSDDGGATWQSANAGLWELTVLALAFSPEAARDHLAFAGTSAGLHVSRNRGKSWRLIDAACDEVAVQCLAVSPRFGCDRLVLAGTEAHGLLRSDDAGTTWQSVSSLATTGVSALAFSPEYAVFPEWGAVAAGTGDGVAVSYDAGQTWHAIGHDVGPVLTLAFAQRPGHEALLVGTLARGVATLLRQRGSEVFTNDN